MALLLFSRVFKQMLRSNLAEKHVEEVLLGVLFLLNAAKKTDQAFHAAAQTSARTVRSFCTNVQNMVQYLQEKSHRGGRRSQHSCFQWFNRTGLAKLSTTSWLQDRLSSTHQDDVGETLEQGEVDLTMNYIQHRYFTLSSYNTTTLLQPVFLYFSYSNYNDRWTCTKPITHDNLS